MSNADCTLCGKPVDQEHLLLCDECLSHRHKHWKGSYYYFCYKDSCPEPRDDAAR